MNLEKLKGKFISFEGVEGAGKSTQSKKLVDYLNDNCIKSIWTREPGGCKEAEEIRQVVVNGGREKFDGITELLLMNASRRVHTVKKIKPLLEEGFVIVSDRYLDSSVAYQGFGHKIDLDSVKAVQKIVLGDFKPDLTIIFDMDVLDGLVRTQKRNDQNRYEDMALEFHERVRKGFRYIAEKEPERCKIIEVGDKTIDEVFQEILNILDKSF